MIDKLTLSKLTFGSALVLGLAFAGSANAGFVSCTGDDYDISGKVTPSTDCSILKPIGGNTNDFVGGNDSSDWTVNQEAFFDYDDWLFEGRWQYDKEQEKLVVGEGDEFTRLFRFDGDAQSGDWTLTGDFWDSNSDLMFVLKDGADTNLVGYLIQEFVESGTQEFVESGTYESPFTDPPFPTGNDNARDISHISIYYREGDGNGNGTPPAEVPAPGVLGLFGLGLLGLGWITMSRRKID